MKTKITTHVACMVYLLAEAQLTKSAPFSDESQRNRLTAEAIETWLKVQGYTLSIRYDYDPDDMCDVPAWIYILKQDGHEPLEVCQVIMDDGKPEVWGLTCINDYEWDEQQINETKTIAD